VSRVNSKLKFRNDNHFLGSYDVNRLKYEDLKEVFQEQLNIKLQSSKFDNVEAGWNNFRKKLDLRQNNLGARIFAQEGIFWRRRVHKIEKRVKICLYIFLRVGQKFGGLKKPSSSPPPRYGLA
jgi:hypothetical protein